MNSEMIINCRAPCIWMRVRDKILYFLSLLLWVTLLPLLFRMEISELIYFFTSFYLAMVLLVSMLLVAWSHYKKTVSRLLAKKQDRRTRYTLLHPHAAAKHFSLEEKHLCALQREKSTIVQHGKDGHVSSVVFHNHSITPPALFTKDNAWYCAVA